MSKSIQTRVTEGGNVHLEFSGFTGHDCQTEEERLRRELTELGLIVEPKVALKSSTGGTGVVSIGHGVHVTHQCVSGRIKLTHLGSLQTDPPFAALF